MGAFRVPSSLPLCGFCGNRVDNERLRSAWMDLEVQVSRDRILPKLLNCKTATDGQSCFTRRLFQSGYGGLTIG